MRSEIEFNDLFSFQSRFLGTDHMATKVELGNPIWTISWMSFELFLGRLGLFFPW